MAVTDSGAPRLGKIFLGNSTAFITGGTATGTTAITAEVGAANNGNIYFSTNGSGELWFGLAGTWTKLTIN